MVDKLPDVANVAAGALFFGQFLGDRSFSPWLAVLGVVLWAVLTGWAIFLAGAGET